jgi:membrane protein DedA with SNARE-associated domain
VVLTLRFGINGAAIGWSLRAALDSCALFWMAGLKRADVLTASAPPTALLLASAAAAHFFGFSLVPAFLSACVAGLIALGLSYAFCEDWRLVLQRTLSRGWRFGGGLIVSLRRTQAIKTGPLE